ncbi:uncharacterized protein LOC144577414 [Callithrix jacchus]
MLSSPAAAFSPPTSELDPLDQMERGIDHSSSRHPPMDTCQLVTEAVLKEPDRSADSPIWVPECLVKHEHKQQTKSKLLDPEISSTASDDSYSLQTPVPTEQQT